MYKMRIMYKKCIKKIKNNLDLFHNFVKLGVWNKQKQSKVISVNVGLIAQTQKAKLTTLSHIQ